MSFLNSLGDASSGPGTWREETGTLRCSRKGCRQEARWQILWNNPRLHTPERRKIWLACAEHQEWLEDYLRLRGFWRDTLRLDSLDNPGSTDDTPGNPRGDGEGKAH